MVGILLLQDFIAIFLLVFLDQGELAQAEVLRTLLAFPALLLLAWGMTRFVLVPLIAFVAFQAGSTHNFSRNLPRAWPLRTALRLGPSRSRLISVAIRSRPAGFQSVARRFHSADLTSGVLGGIHIPSDGYANAVDVTNALARGATAARARIFQNTPVAEILTSAGRVSGVATDRGEIRADNDG